MEWLNQWTKDQLADYFVAARSLMNDKAGAITDRDWSTLNGRIARPIAEMKQLRDSFGQLILAEESTPEQFITAVQNRDVTEFDVHRSTVNASKARRNTKLSARAAEGQATEEAVRSNTRSAKRAAALKGNRDPPGLGDSTFFASTTTDLADSTDDVARVLAFGLGSSLPPASPLIPVPPIRAPSNPESLGINSFLHHDSIPSDDFRNGALKNSPSFSSSLPASIPSTTQNYANPSKKSESKVSRVAGRKIRAKSELDNDPIILTPALSHSLSSSLRASLPPVNTAPPLETLNTAFREPHGEALRRFATYEWFYPNIDQDWFQHSDFLSMLHSLHLGRMETGTRAQWNLVRRAFGTPRRMSKTFFHEERDKLEQHRSYVRLLRPRAGLSTTSLMPAPQTEPISPSSLVPGEVPMTALGQFASSSQPQLEHVAIHSAHANPNDSVDEMWASDAAGDPNALGIRVPLGTLGVSNAHGVGYISKDKSQVIPKGTRVVVWTKGILSTRPSATAVHSAAARKGRKSGSSDPLSLAGGSSSGGKISSVDVSTTSTIHEEDEDDHDSETDAELSLDGVIMEEGEGENDEASESLAESEPLMKSRVSSSASEAKLRAISGEQMDVDGADSPVSVNRSTLISVPSEGRSGAVVSMPSEVVSGRVVKCKKDNTYQVQLAGALENGSHVVTVDDVHIMSCDVNRVSAKRRSAVNTYKVAFNQHEVHSRLHPLAGGNQTDVLKSVMLQTPHFFGPDYNLTAIVMLLLDWKEVILSDMGKALDTLEKSKRTLDAVDAGTKTLAATSVSSLRNKYNSSENAVINLTERLHVINEQLAQYRPNLVERRIMVASSHLVAAAVHSSRTLAEVALTMIPSASMTAAAVAAARCSDDDSQPSTDSSSSTQDVKSEKTIGGEGKSPEEKENSNAMDVSAPEDLVPATPVKADASSNTSSEDSKIATGGEDGASKPVEQNGALSSPDGLTTLASLAKSPEKDEIRLLEDESMMTLTELLVSTPTKRRAVGSGAIPRALSATSSNPLPALPSSRSRSFSMDIEDGDESFYPNNSVFSEYEEEPQLSRDAEAIRNRIASSLALIKVLAQDGITADVREATVKVALNILQAEHHSQNNLLFESIKTQCEELLHVLASSERF